MQRTCTMKTAAIGSLIVIATITGLGTGTSAQPGDIGKAQYQASCASCHGSDGKGDGPVAQALKTPPADLTMLAKNNNGVFPYDRVYQMIDGRNMTIPSHGTREMPVWGYRFGPVEAFRFKARMLAVIDYVKSLQQK
jgi:mono/diheme cytochrome c family protein